MTKTGLVLAVYFPSALLALCQGVLVATLPLYAATFDVSYSWVSIAVAAASIGTLLADLPAGEIVGRIGLSRSMILGAILVAVSTLALGFGRTFVGLILLRLAAGIGTSIWQLSRHALLAESVSNASRGRATSFYGGTVRLGTFIGPAIGGVVGKAYGLQAPFIVSGALAVGAVGLAVICRSVNPTSRPVATQGPRWPIVLRLLRTDWRDIGAAGAAQICGQMIRAGIKFLIPIYGATVLDLDAAQIGLILTFSALVDVALFLPVGMAMDRFGRKVMSVPCFAVMAVGVALVPLTNSYLGLLLASTVMSFGNGLGAGSMMTLGADLAPREAAREFLGVWRLIGDTGMVAGPVAVGAIASGLSLTKSALVLALIGAMASLLLALLVRETRTKPLDVVATRSR